MTSHFRRAPGALNETLYRALLRARLSEEDVAARIDVDPKTVRRWLEGRIPYPRHRWALAGILGLGEADLWPQVRLTPTRSEEVQAIYPHHDAVPLKVWQCFFHSAERETGILADSGLLVAEAPQTLATLRQRIRYGVRVRICLRDPGSSITSSDVVARTRDAIALYGQLRETGELEIRLHRVTLNNSIYRADDELLVGQRAFGVTVRQAPVLHLRRTGKGEMVDTYLESFNRIWVSALPS